MASFPNLNKSIFKTDYGLNEINPSSLPLFDYTGKLTEVAGGYLGNDPTKGAFTWSPFQMAQSTGGVDGPGKWTDGGWVADPTNYWGIYQSGDPGMGRSALSGHTAANIPLNDPNTELVRMPDGQWGYRRWGADLPVQRHDPAHSSFDAIADFWMPVIGSAVVGGIGAGAMMGGTGGAAGASAAGAEGALAGGAMDMGIGLGEVYGIGQGAAGAGTGAWGANMNGYDSFLQSIGIDPASTQFAGGTMTNADIASQIGGGNWWDSLSNFTNSPPTGGLTGGDGTVSDGSGGPVSNTAGGISQNTLNTFFENLGLTPQQAGSLLSSGLGLLGSNAQANALSGIANNQAAFQQQALAMGAPYRAQALQMLTNPDSFFSGQVAQDNLKGVLQGLSVNGNPFGNPTSLALAQQGQRGLYNSTLGNLGQLGGLGGFNAAAANNNLSTQLALEQAKQQGNSWNAVGAGLNGFLNPQPNWLDLLTTLSKGSALPSSLA